MTTYICKCGRRVKKSTDTSTTGNRLSGYAPGHECWGCPYAMPYGNFQWDESAKTVAMETRGYECRMSKTLTYASEFSGSIKDKCTCRVHSLDFDFLSQVSAWIKDTYADDGTVRVEYDINSLVTYTSEIGEVYRYNRTMRLCNTIANDLYSQFSKNYVGIVDNTDAGRMEYKSAVVKYLTQLQASGGIQNFDGETDVTVEKGDAKDAVLITLAIEAVGSTNKMAHKPGVCAAAGRLSADRCAQRGAVH